MLITQVPFIYFHRLYIYIFEYIHIYIFEYKYIFELGIVILLLRAKLFILSVYTQLPNFLLPHKPYHKFIDQKTDIKTDLSLSLILTTAKNIKPCQFTMFSVSHIYPSPVHHFSLGLLQLLASSDPCNASAIPPTDCLR